MVPGGQLNMRNCLRPEASATKAGSGVLRKARPVRVERAEADIVAIASGRSSRQQAQMPAANALLLGKAPFERIPRARSACDQDDTDCLLVHVARAKVSHCVLGTSGVIARVEACCGEMVRYVASLAGPL